MDIAKIRKKSRQRKKKREKVKDESAAETESAAAELAGTAAEEEPHPVPASEAVEEQRAVDETAAEREDGDEVSEAVVLEFLVFNLSDELYAFRLPQLQEVLREQIVTFVPKMPEFIMGITSLRGKIIPVMDLRSRLLIDEGEEVKGRKIAIVKGGRGPIGMMIDRVIGVRRIEETAVQETPSHLDEKRARFIDAVVRDGRKFISILDLDEVLDFQPFPL